MKKIFTIAIALFHIHAFGQTQPNKDLNGVVYDVPFFEQISSDWRNANPNKINHFNWTNSSTSNRTFSSFSFPITDPNTGIRYYSADPVELPFYRTSVPNVNNPNLLPYAINPFIPRNLDIHPEDGWEIITMDFGGRMVAQNKLAMGNEVNIFPYFVIYNRYTSKLRVYYLVPKVENFNGAFITASFPGRDPYNPRTRLEPRNSVRTALFSHAYPITNHLEEWNNKAYLTATNAYQSNMGILQWIYGEFDVAYDPCTCLLKDINKNAKIYFQLYTTALSKIDLKGESTTINNVADPARAGGSNTTATRSSFMDDINGIWGTGQEYYNTWDKYGKNANKFLDKGYDLWSKKIEREFFKYYSGGITDPKTGLPLNNLADLKKSDIWNEWLSIEKSNNPTLNLLKSMKNVTTYVPYVGVAIGITDYLVNGAKKDEQTVAAPSVSQTKYNFTGTLTYTSAPVTTIVNVPGAKNQNFFTIDNSNNDGGRLQNGTYLESTVNPIYNQTLGVFNLLGAPKFESIDYNKTHKLVKLNGEGVGGYKAIDNSVQVINWFAIQQCKITEIPKYVVNPAADVEVISIDAAIVLEFESNADGYNLFMDKYTEWQKFVTLPLYKNYWKNASAITLEDRIKSIEEAGLELEYVSDAYPNQPGSVIRFRTAYVPYNCLTIPNFSIINWNKGMKVYLKLMVRLQRKHEGSSANFTSFSNENDKIPLNMVLTYDVTNSFNQRINNTWSEKGSVNIAATPYLIYDIQRKSVSPLNFQEAAEGLYFLGDFRAYTINILSTAYQNPFFPGGNVTYNGSSNVYTVGDVFIPSGSTIPPNSFIKSGGKIVIEDGVIIGANTEIIAGEEIIVKNTNDINPETVFKIEQGIWINQACMNAEVSSLRANDDEIRNLCNSNNYKARSGLDKRNVIDQNIENIIPKHNYNLSMNIFPNPANAQVLIIISDISDYLITLIDITGREVITSKINKGDKISVDVSQLQNGIYIVQVTGNGHTTTQKIIVKH